MSAAGFGCIGWRSGGGLDGYFDWLAGEGGGDGGWSLVGELGFGVALEVAWSQEGRVESGLGGDAGEDAAYAVAGEGVGGEVTVACDPDEQGFVVVA